MATMDASGSLMEIASSLTQDEIPFKLRCAICNKLAINAFRLPCCDQAICENCQATLPESCPVCDHNPISPDLCKPNKALRTTLKAFLRTEEKKRERDRPSATPATPTVPTSLETSATNDLAASSVADEQDPGAIEPSVAVPEESVNTDPPAAAASIEGPVDSAGDADEQQHNAEESQITETSQEDDVEIITEAAGANHGNVDSSEADGQSSLPGMAPFTGPTNMMSNELGFGMNPAMLQTMGWNGTPDFSAMGQFMPNAMNNFPNTTGMAGMGMDPMAATQGMFGGFGMNGMNMGMGFDAGQQMYGNWNNSQNTMYNPIAFSNGMGPDYGASGYAGGFNMSHQNGNYPQMHQASHFPRQDYQNGYHGYGQQGYGRGMGRGRGRGFFRGRGGYSNGPMNANNYPSNHPNYGGYQNQTNYPQDTSDSTATAPSDADLKRFNDELAPGGEDDLVDGQAKDDSAIAPVAVVAPDSNKTDAHNVNAEDSAVALEDDPSQSQQLQGIPTIDSIDAPSPPSAFSNGMPMVEQGFGRGRPFVRGGFYGGRGGYQNGNFQGPAPPGKGVIGAPAAPRAMRQGLPNTSVRGRPLPIHGRNPILGHNSEEGSPSVTPMAILQDQNHPKSPSVSTSRAHSQSQPLHHGSRAHSRSRSPSDRGSHHDRRRPDRSESRHESHGGPEPNRDRHARRSRREEDEDEPHQRQGDRSLSPSQGESSRRSQKDRDRASHRSHRSRRHRTRSVSSRERESAIPGDASSVKGDLASRISSSHRSGKDSSSRREEDRESRRERDRDRERRRDRDPDRDGDRDRNRDRERHRGKDRERDRDKHRKRSRRDRSESVDDSNASRRHSRRAKKSHRDESDKERRNASERESRPSDAAKDPHTLEREARNRERMLKEQQRREAMNGDRDAESRRRRENRNDRGLAGGRRLSYKYENDDDDMARTEREREASRWA